MKKIAALLTTVTALISGVAFATPIQSLEATGFQFSPVTTVQISLSQPQFTDSVHAGAFVTTASDTPDPFMAWCIDIFQSTNIGEMVLDYQRVPSSSVLSASRVMQMEQLATRSLALVVDGLTSAAFQLAIWEITSETNGSLDLGKGNFTATGADDAVLLANSWLGGLGGTVAPTRYGLSAMTSASRQDLATFNDVPEPSTLAVLAAGMLGFAAVRRRSSRLFSEKNS